jgi:hypothetical protein
MKTCRECNQEIPEQAATCPACGAPSPATVKTDGWGYEYKSAAAVMGLPLLHISFKYRRNGVPVPAKGVIAIGQFALGGFTLSQFGLGVISISQITVAGFAIAQIGVAYSLIAQVGLYFHEGYGQVVGNIMDLISK